MEEKSRVKKIPFFKTVTGMNVISYVALLLLFVLTIVSVIAQMNNMSSTAQDSSELIEGLMDDIRVFEVDMRIIDNDGFAMAAMYETIKGLGQLETKIPEMKNCLTEMDEAVEGMVSGFTVISGFSGNTVGLDAANKIKELYTPYRDEYVRVIEAGEKGDVDTIVAVVYGEAAGNLEGLKEQLSIMDEEIKKGQAESKAKVSASTNSALALVNIVTLIYIAAIAISLSLTIEQLVKRLIPSLQRSIISLMISIMTRVILPFVCRRKLHPSLLM